MIRALIYVIAAYATIGLAAAAQPYPRADISDDYVALSDVFRDIGEMADIIVARSPAPGQRVLYSAGQMAALARKHGLKWQPNRQYEGTLVVRSGVPVTRAAIAGAIAKALHSKGAGANLGVRIANRDLKIFAPASAKPVVSVSQLEYDSKTRHFSAIVAAAGTTSPVETRVVGETFRIVAVPVPNRPIAVGEVVGVQDLETLNLRMQQVDRWMLTDPAAVIGKSAIRGLQPGKPVRARDLSEPVLIQKGALVTMLLSSPGLVLTATGRALEDGAGQQLIRVINEHSKRTVRAVVTGPNSVRVFSQQQRLALDTPRSKRNQ